MKKLLLGILTASLLSTLMAKEITKEACSAMKGSFIFAGGECIQYALIEGDKAKTINIIVHGTWKEGTDVLARYTPFAETINMATDITTIAIALPGYSGSSTNHLSALAHKGTDKLYATKAYISFLAQLIQALKKQFSATTVNYIGHSAGASMGATLTGYHPALIHTITLVGAKYRGSEAEAKKGLLFISHYLDALNKQTQYLLIYGTKDMVSKPKETKDFYQVAKKKGLQVTLIEVKGAAHLDLDMTDTSIEAIEAMLE